MNSDDEGRHLSSSTGLTALHALLVVAILLFGFSAMVALLVLVNGAPTVRLDASITARPLTIEQDGSRWDLETELRTRTHLAHPEGSDEYGEPGSFAVRSVEGFVNLGERTDPAAATTYQVGLAVMSALAAIAFVLLRRIVADARAGDPFAAPGTRRLRIAAAAVLAIPLTAEIIEFRLSQVDVGTAIAVHPDVLPWWPFLLLGAGAFALAEIFRRGSELSDFEQLAI